ncbi:MAG: hypothetical protein HY279_11500 [Nitrospinae bacterium]|nr:hypothetical protein [Nitrospinota bacterium]
MKRDLEKLWVNNKHYDCRRIVRSGKIKKNDIVVFCSQGLGFNFATAIFRCE